MTICNPALPASGPADTAPIRECPLESGLRRVKTEFNFHTRLSFSQAATRFAGRQNRGADIMSECRHEWEMGNIQFGFVVFEKCFQCNGVRTYFTQEGIAILGDEYREGDHFWHRVENAQSFRFELTCSRCGLRENYDDLMGLFFCTGCMSDCKVEFLRQQLEASRAHLILACGFLGENQSKPKQIATAKLEKLAAYFNQRRDPLRARIAIYPFDLEDGFAHCKGEFLHDVGMLSQTPVTSRQSPF
jgi:hypothetical protein